MLVTSRTISIFGDRFAEIALPLALYERSGNFAVAGLYAAANFLPSLVLPHRLGRWVDRADRGRVLVAADIFRAVGYALLAIVLGTHVVPIVVTVPIAFATGMLDALASISGSTFIVEVTPREALLRANSRLESGDAIASLAAPALAGATIAVASSSAALGVDAATFAVSALLIRTLIRDRRGEPDAPRPATTHWRETYVAVARVPRLRTAIAATAALGLHSGGVIIAIIAVAERHLDLSAEQVGLIVSAAGAGALASSLLISPRLDHVRWNLALLWALGASIAGLVAIAAAPGFVALLLATFVMDAAVSTAFVVAGTVRQTVTPAHRLGAVNGINLQLGAGARVLGSTAAGLTAAVAQGRGAVVLPILALLGVGLAGARDVPPTASELFDELQPAEELA